MPTPLEQAVIQFLIDSNKVHEIVHGPNNATVFTEGGEVKTLAKMLKDGDDLAAAGEATRTSIFNSAQSTLFAARDETLTARDVALTSASTALVSGAYPNTAATNVPRGLTAASVGAIIPGSGGTNGTHALSFSGGNFLINPTGNFTVANGVVTSVTITGSGLYIGASPSVPTPSFAASSGLTGAGVVLTAQFLVTSGSGYWVQSSDGNSFSRYNNVSGVATLDTTVQAIPSSAFVTFFTTDTLGGPFRRDDYGHTKRFPNISIVTSTDVTLDSTGNRFTLGATTGSLAMSSPLYIPVAQNDTIVVWFEAITGVPSTAQIRFYNGGTPLDSSQNMTRLGNYYFLVATATNASTTGVRVSVTNTTGSGIVMTRPCAAFLKTTTKDGRPDSNYVALRNLAARSTSDSATNMWRIDSIGKVAGSGVTATLNGDGTVLCPPDAIHFIRADIAVNPGDSHVWLVKMDEANPNIRGVRIYYNGSTSALVQLESLGSGWWGKITPVPAVGTTIYVRVEVDNSTNTQYTATNATVKTITLINGTQFPNQLPTADGGPYDKTELYVRQVPAEIMVFKAGTKPGSNRYIGWPIEKYTGMLGGGANWKIARFEESIRDGVDHFVRLGWIADAGHHQLAVREINQTFIGSGHGYEIGGQIPSMGNATITSANPAVVSFTGHGLVANTPITFSTTATLPSPLIPGVTYYVLASGLTADTFNISATAGGAAISTLGSTQFGDHQLRRGVVTLTIASPCVITLNNHGFVAGDQVALTTTGALPTGLPVGTPLYVIATGLTANSFRVSLTNGGAAINTSGSQSGVHTVRKRTDAFFVDGVKKSSDTTANYRCRQVRMLLHSTLFSTVTTGLPLFSVVTEITMDHQYTLLRNRLTCLSPVTMGEMYLAMFSIAKQFNTNSGTVQLDYVYPEPDFGEISVATGTNSNLSFSKRHLYTGSNGFSAEVEVLEGWTRPERRSWIQNAGGATGNMKSYFSATGVNSTGGLGSSSGFSFVAGDVVEMVTRFCLNTSN